MAEKTLRDLIAERGFVGEPEIYRLFIDVADGLEAAHTQGSLHGDVKPEKIVRSRAGGKYGLVDYGVSRLGTARYMSPERARRIPADVRSDIYSLGAVMYEAATGKPPFEGLNYQLLQAHINETPPLPKSIRPGISAGLQRVIITAMAKAPSDRYRSAGALADALREVAEEFANNRTSRPATEAPRAPAENLDDNGAPLTPAKTPVGTMSGRRPPAKTAGAQAPEPVARPPSNAEEGRAVPSAPAAASLSARPVSTPAPAKPATRPVKRDKSPAPAVRARVAKPTSSIRAGIRSPGRPVLIAGAAGLVVLVGLILVLTLPGRGTRVPVLVGLDEPAAVNLAGESGLVVVEAGVQDDTLPAGLVAAQRPEPRARVQEGDTIFILLSTGEVVVPDVASLDPAEAAMVLAGAGLRVMNTDSGYSDEQPVGAVFAVIPAIGSRVEAQSEVRLRVATGRATCPDCGARRAAGARFCIACGHGFAQ